MNYDLLLQIKTPLPMKDPQKDQGGGERVNTKY
jgi:hypothetical protein